MTDRDLFHTVDAGVANIPFVGWKDRGSEEWKRFPNETSVSHEGYFIPLGHRLIIELASDGHLSMILQRIG